MYTPCTAVYTIQSFRAGYEIAEALEDADAEVRWDACTPEGSAERRRAAAWYVVRGVL